MSVSKNQTLPASLLTGLLLLSFTMYAAWFDFLPYTAIQPDGTVIECFVSGDEFHNWMHDENGYTIISGTDGFYYYATLVNDLPQASEHRVNTIDPNEAGLQPWINIPVDKYNKIKEEFLSHIPKGITAPHTGDMNNLVVYIRFSDQTEFTTPRTIYDARFNDPDNSSQKHYFYEVSYENLIIESHHYPVCELTTNLSYQDVHPRAYYEPYHAVNNPIGYQNSTQRRDREHILLANAIAFIAPEVPPDMVIDADNDGLVDNVCFIIRGGNGAWASLLWAHRWVLFSQEAYINGKRVWDYTFQPETQNDTYTLCHEMYHVLGAPDLYRYSGSGITPVGNWDLMASGFVHMGAFMKWKYADQNWVTEIPEITTAGIYTLNPLTSPENNAYKIASPNSSHEYFVVEYRKQEGLYESNLSGSGLIVYRIDPSAGNGNASGPPDEVYIYRPNGTPTANGGLGQAHFNASVNRTAINDETNPSSFLQNGNPGGLNIFDITEAGSTISFSILMGNEVFADFETSATTVPTGGTANYTDLSTNEPDFWEWHFEGGTPAASNEQNPVVQYHENGMYAVTLIAANEFSIDTITKNDLIIVGTPVASVQPQTFNLTLEPNKIYFDTFTINNPGNTWLRYGLSTEYTGSDPGGEPGSVIKTYANMPGGQSGMAWVGNELYIVSMANSTLSIYDTVSAMITETYNIHENPFGIVYDGELLWIGNTTGLINAYHTDGTPAGNSFELPVSSINALAWDGDHFISNTAGLSNPQFYRIDQQGNIIQTLSTDLPGRVTQSVWVSQHTEGQFWVNSLGSIVRLKESNGSFLLMQEFNSPANLSYSLAHDGTDLWWSAMSGDLYQIDDGVPEWVVVEWDETLLQSGHLHEIPLTFNTKSLAEEAHTAKLLVHSNDPSQPLQEIEITVNISSSTGIHENYFEEVKISAINGTLNIKLSEPSSSLTEIYDLSGRLIQSVQSKDQLIEVNGLPRNTLYILRISTSDYSATGKVFLF